MNLRTFLQENGTNNQNQTKTSDSGDTFERRFQWFFPVLFVFLLTAIQMFVIAVHFLPEGRLKFFLEVVYPLNVSFETGVGLRVEFEHNNGIIKLNSILTTMSSFAALLCVFVDIYKANKKKMRFVPHYEEWYFRYWRRMVGYVAAYFDAFCGTDRWLVLVALLQFILRVLELTLRFYCGRKKCKSIQFLLRSDYTAAPLALAAVTCLTRLTQHKKWDNSVSLLILASRPQPQVNAADAQGGEEIEMQEIQQLDDAAAFQAAVDSAVQAALPAAIQAQLAIAANPSPLVNAIRIRGNENYRTSVFDLTTKSLRVNDALVEFKLWEIRPGHDLNNEWSAAPNVDFIISCFSKDSRQSFEGVAAQVTALKVLAPKVPIILVGLAGEQEDVTDAEGEALTSQLKAKSYRAVDFGDAQSVDGLLKKIVKLM